MTEGGRRALIRGASRVRTSAGERPCHHRPVEIVDLRRYPVKSTQGEALERAEVGPTGIVGDRSHALRDATTGVVLTARRDPELLLARGRLAGEGGGARVVLPDGTAVEGPGAEADAALSAWLGRPVELVGPSGERSTYEIPVDPEDDGSEVRTWQGPAGTYHDSTRTQVSIVATGDLGGWDVRRFRPNVVVDAPTADVLVGHRVRLGGAVLEVVKQIDRCVMVTRPQPGGIERDLDVLRTIRRQRDLLLAVGALVVEPGPVRVGDTLTVL